jgi:hypothetical protein
MRTGTKNNDGNMSVSQLQRLVGKTTGNTSGEVYSADLQASRNVLLAKGRTNKAEVVGKLDYNLRDVRGEAGKYSADELRQVAAQDGRKRSISIADADQAGSVLNVQA